MSIPNALVMTEKKESLAKIIITFFIIVATRILLDSFAYPAEGGYFFPLERFIHVPLYFFSIFLSFSLVVYCLTKADFEDVLSCATKAFLFILAVPLSDLAFSGPVTNALKYVFIGKEDFLVIFFKLLDPFGVKGITLGQHIGAGLIFFMLAVYVYQKTRSYLKAGFSMVINYAILCLYAILPSILVFWGGKNTASDVLVASSYHDMLKTSWVANVFGKSTSLANLFYSNDAPVHEMAMARTYWLLIFLQIGTVFFFAGRRIWSAFKSDLRIERILYWFIIASSGILLGGKAAGFVAWQNPVNTISLAIFFSLIVLNIWLAVLINDKEDVAIDKISNPERPLAKNTLDKKDWLTMQAVLVSLIIAGLLTLGGLVMLFLALSQAFYYLYSVGPLKLKRHFLTSSLSIGATSVIVSMAGFFLVFPDQRISLFPIKAMVLIGTAYALLSNLKDLKDFKGDKHEGIKTIPVVFGLENSKRIIAALFAVVTIGIPVVLGIYQAMFFSVSVSLFIYFLFTKKEYQEKYIFSVFFIYVFVLFLIVRSI